MIKNKILVIAEAGVNHNGSLALAKEMAYVARECGADIVKYQTSISSTSKYSEKAKYQKRETGDEGSQLDMIKKLRLSFDEHIKLKEYCDSIGIKYLSTPFDFESIDFLNKLCDIWKIPSGEIINVPYLERISQYPKEIIMSTGMSDLSEIQNALDILQSRISNKITLLQCTTQYPTPYCDINLRVLRTLKEKFNLEVGLSDHSLGIEVPIAAVALGATVIEKHFTLDKNMSGPDQKASVDPQELKQMIISIRNVVQALGASEKVVCDSERENMYVARKSIVALRDIKKGEVFSVDNIVPRHAGHGIEASQWYNVLGKKAKRDFIEDEMIEI